MAAPSGSAPPPPPSVPEMDFGPGSYEELHKKAKDVFPICFDGAKLMINKGLSNVFQVSHTVSLTPQSHSYRFGATFVGPKQISPQESYPVLLGDTDLSGNLTATAIHSWTSRFRQRFQLQLAKGQIGGAQLTSEYRGRLHAASLTLANTDLVQEQGIVVAQYMRKVHPKLDLGTELIYQHSRQIPGGQFSNLSYALRYNGDKFTASLSAGKQGLHVCYHHKQSDQLQMSVEWETNLRMQESTATIGYMYELPKADITFKAMLDTEGSVGATMEKRLAPMPFTFAISGLINHLKHKSNFGIGLIVGQ